MSESSAGCAALDIAPFFMGCCVLCLGALARPFFCVCNNNTKPLTMQVMLTM